MWLVIEILDSSFNQSAINNVHLYFFQQNLLRFIYVLCTVRCSHICFEAGERTHKRVNI